MIWLFVGIVGGWLLARWSYRRQLKQMSKDLQVSTRNLRDAEEENQ